jgi:hypothetical protein
VNISRNDLFLLRGGKPPLDVKLASEMTIGRDLWLDHFVNHYLTNYIAYGGSKVKFLVGNEGTGKTHMLYNIQYEAEKLGYASVFISARISEYRLNDMPNLYREIASKIDVDQIVKGLCATVLRQLGYEKEINKSNGDLINLLMEEGLNRSAAEREVRKAIWTVTRNIDFGSSFATFVNNVVTDTLVNKKHSKVEIAFKWITGQRLDRYEKQSTGLFETLQRSNSKSWFNSLIKTLNVAGITGLIVLLDDIEVITERTSMSNRFLYTTTATKDTYELFRQIIDDCEALQGLLFIMAGRRCVLEDHHRGFRSYEALWMRIQTGLVPTRRFNPLADIVDMDKHLEGMGEDIDIKISEKLSKTIDAWGRKSKENKLPSTQDDYLQLDRKQSVNSLKSSIINNALMIEVEDACD